MCFIVFPFAIIDSGCFGPLSAEIYPVSFEGQSLEFLSSYFWLRVLVGPRQPTPRKCINGLFGPLRFQNTNMSHPFHKRYVRTLWDRKINSINVQVFLFFCFFGRPFGSIGSFYKSVNFPVYKKKSPPLDSINMLRL